MNRSRYTQASKLVAVCIASIIAEGGHEGTAASRDPPIPKFNCRVAGGRRILCCPAARRAADRCSATCCPKACCEIASRFQRKNHGSFGNAIRGCPSERHLHAQRQAGRLGLPS